MHVDDLLARGVRKRGGDLRCITWWTPRASIGGVATINAGTATSPGSLSNKVSPELLRPVTDEVTTIPATPGGAGLVEGAVALSLGLFLKDQHLAVSIALLDRLINYWSLVVGGLVLYLISRRK